MLEKTRRKNIHGIFGFIMMGVSLILMAARIEPFFSWFYPFAWWSYILIVDSIIYRIKNDSLIMSRTGEFWLMIPWSIFIWLFFEFINLFMNNWYYINVTDISWIRWIGYAISFGTVLPGIFETTEFLEAIGLYKNSSIKKITLTPRWCKISFGLGIAFLIAPVIFPRSCFALIWGSLIFLLEPIIYQLGGRSLLGEWEQGRVRKFYLLLTAGLICGFLWEFWNYWSNTKWIYTVPFFNEVKIFEMPVMGYLGFPPFAVECYIIYNFISLFRHGRGWEMDNYRANQTKKAGRLTALIVSAVILVFSFLMFQGLDRHTVGSYRTYLADLRLMNPSNLLKLRELHIVTANDLLNRAKTEEELINLAKVLQIPSEKIEKWIQITQITRIKGVGSKNTLLLLKAGVNTLEKLAGENPETLHGKLKKTHLNGSGAAGMPPTKAMVKVWIRGAQGGSWQKNNR